MRKTLWIGAASLALASAATYWYFDAGALPEYATRHAVTWEPTRVQPDPKVISEEEACDVTDSLIVETSEPALSTAEPSLFEVAPLLPRVEMVAGTQQAARPDALAGPILRMPYADEDEILDFTFNPVLRMLESTLPRLNFFADETANPTEESEPKAESPVDPKPEEAPAPEPDPALDYHHHQQYCPYSGGCPYPYMRR